MDFTSDSDAEPAAAAESSCETSSQQQAEVRHAWSRLLLRLLPHCMEYRRGLAMRKLSVCPSVRQTRELWQNGKKICPDFYTIRKII